MNDATSEQTRFLYAQSLMLASQTAPSLHWRTTATDRGRSTEKPKRDRRKTERGAEFQARGSNATAKPAHITHKERRNELIKQVRCMETQLARLRQRVGLPTAADKQAITDQEAQNTMLDDHVHARQRGVEQLQSMVRQTLQSSAVDPLSSYIHLPCGQSHRRAILEGMKHVKLRRAAEIGIERFRYLDPTKPYLSEERFMTDDGIHHCNRWEMNVFPQFESARQMFEATLFWISNMEISVTENLNQLVVREDNDEYDTTEPTMWNHRIVSTEEIVGCTEVNLVGFGQYYEHYDLLDGAPLGIIICDTVDEDDLYPYKPLERTRKDAKSILLFNEVVDPETQRKSVVFKAVNLIAQLPPQFPMELRAIKKLQKDSTRWPEVISQFLAVYRVLC